MPVYFLKKQVFFSGPAKQSAKGVTRDARRSMTHELYKRTLLGGEVVRLLNTRIASSNHRLHTIVVNKKSLSGYDDKRFIMNDQVSTLPYGHQSLRDDMFFRTIVNDPDWGSADEETEKEQQQKTQQKNKHQPQDSTTQQHKNKQQKQQQQQQPSIAQTSSIHNTSFDSIPDPGFHQREYSEDELNENLDFDKLSDLSDSGSSTEPACDDFILDQAVESDNASVSSDIQVSLAATESKKRKKKAGKGAAKKPRARIIDYSSTDEY